MKITKAIVIVLIAFSLYGCTTTKESEEISVEKTTVEEPTYSLNLKDVPLNYLPDIEAEKIISFDKEGKPSHFFGIQIGDSADRAVYLMPSFPEESTELNTGGRLCISSHAPVESSSFYLYSLATRDEKIVMAGGNMTVFAEKEKILQIFDNVVKQLSAVLGEPDVRVNILRADSIFSDEESWKESIRYDDRKIYARWYYEESNIGMIEVKIEDPFSICIYALSPTMTYSSLGEKVSQEFGIGVGSSLESLLNKENFIFEKDYKDKTMIFLREQRMQDNEGYYIFVDEGKIAGIVYTVGLFSQDAEKLFPSLCDEISRFYGIPSKESSNEKEWETTSFRIKTTCEIDGDVGFINCFLLQ